MGNQTSGVMGQQRTLPPGSQRRVHLCWAVFSVPAARQGSEAVATGLGVKELSSLLSLPPVTNWMTLEGLLMSSGHFS